MLSKVKKAWSYVPKLHLSGFTKFRHQMVYLTGIFLVILGLLHVIAAKEESL